MSVVSLVSWALSHIPQLIFAFVLIQVVRAMVRAAQLSKEHQAPTSETDEQRRVREIQERIRKKIAERRGGVTQRTEPAPSAPLPRPASVPPLEPFGGPSRRMVIETRRRAVPDAEELARIDTAALERQQKLAEQIRALDEARVITERRAGQVVEQRENAAASSSVASASHAGWLGDLRDPQVLRRAFVLREVLGAPVALR